MIQQNAWNSLFQYVNVGIFGGCYLLKRTLGLDAFPSYEDPVIPEAQITDNRAAQISYELPGFIVEPAEQKRILFPGPILEITEAIYINRVNLNYSSKARRTGVLVEKVLTSLRDRRMRPSSPPSRPQFPSGI